MTEDDDDEEEEGLYSRSRSHASRATRLALSEKNLSEKNYLTH